MVLKTVASSALKRFTWRLLQALVELNYEIIREAIEKERLPRLTIDLDGTTETKLSGAVVKRIMSAPHEPNRLSIPVGEEADFYVAGLMGGTSTNDPADEAGRNVAHDAAREALAKLPSREAEVLRLRFGLDEDREHTLQEIGDKFDKSRERIRQIEQQALRRLHQYLTRGEFSATAPPNSLPGPNIHGRS